ncbi:MAG: ABC transporter ATP-binding protein [SAR202 cluster bacterium]|nr:ABC transporter ATP-binding protein [SAR202 cluster bacterium]MQG78812.1 ABC transporter ATP-binding protein [SAR202 cluster bacterium]|tara:strand:+ start:554 stop:2380 length:1827 start_codon:yes stop_codon:yes gene_type:complete
MQILVRITKIAWKFRARLILAYLSFLGAVGVSLLIPQLFGEAIDLLVAIDGDGIVRESTSNRTLTYFALGILGASLLRGFLDFARTYCTDSLSQKVSYDIRNSFYDKLQHLSFAYHDTVHTGDLMSKATADVEAIRRFVNMGLVRALEVVVRVIALLLILSFMNWELTLISLAFVPFIVIRSSMVMGRLRAMWALVQMRMGEAVTILQENLVGIHVVKAFASEEYEKKKFARKAHELREEYYKSERLQGTNSAWMTLFFTSGMGLILWYGGWEVIRGDLTVGGLTKFILYLSQLTFPIRMSSFIINSFSRAITSGGRIFEVLDAESPVMQKSDAAVLERAEGRVEFEDVSFSYSERIPALRHLNISAKPDQITAILGAPGSGKSTIVNLLPRFYDVTEGCITIDGKDIRDFTLESLRHNVGIVQQDVFLFSANIHDNIAYGVKGATREDVIRAAKVAQLHDHIDSLPDGYDTWVGERGATLSGGQRQRLSIARSILTDPPVLILDDSTSSVDVQTERMIHQAMVNVMKNRTTFVIAHRLSTVREADLIVVLKDGQIAEQGTHDELLAANGIYQNIYELQLQPQEELLLDAAITPDSGTPRLASDLGDD